MPKKIKYVCIYGIGGVGGYFGGKIAHEINKGNRTIQVYFIGRGEHLKAVQQQGLYLVTDKEKFLCFPNIATDNIRHIPTPDLYLLGVKGYDLVFPYETKTSFQRDYEKGNTKHEGDIFGGTLICLAKEHNIPIPTIIDVYGASMKR